MSANLSSVNTAAPRVLDSPNAQDALNQPPASDETEGSSNAQPSNVQLSPTASQNLQNPQTPGPDERDMRVAPNLSELSPTLAFAMSNRSGGTTDSPALRQDRLAYSTTAPLPNETPGARSNRDKENDLVPTRARNTEALQYVANVRTNIYDASQRTNVQPEVIAAILFEEGRRTDGGDNAQLREALYNVRNLTKYEPSGLAWKESLGRSQMQVGTLDRLIKNGALDSGKNLVGRDVIPSSLRPSSGEYAKLNAGQRYRICVEILANDKAAPYLTGMYAADLAREYKARGGDPRITDWVSSKYSTNAKQDTAQYHILPQVYSTGVANRPQPVVDPNSPQNYRGFDAKFNYAPINRALSAGVITPFEGWRFGSRN
jgi:hypothetical protein